MAAADGRRKLPWEDSGTPLRPRHAALRRGVGTAHRPVNLDPPTRAYTINLRFRKLSALPTINEDTGIRAGATRPHCARAQFGTPRTTVVRRVRVAHPDGIGRTPVATASCRCERVCYDAVPRAATRCETCGPRPRTA